MDRQQLLDRLDFHDDCVFDHQIHPIRTVQIEALCSERQMDLPLKREPSRLSS